MLPDVGQATRRIAIVADLKALIRVKHVLVSE